MKKHLSKWLLPVLLLSFSAVTFAASNVIPQMLAKYQSEGAKNFSAASGKAMFTKKFAAEDGGAQRSCTTCHGTDLKKEGSHARTGKVIEPMAPSANAERFTDEAKIEKWFLRNCKWTTGRECTPQEKGDLLTYLGSQ